MRDFRNLAVWTRSHEFLIKVYKVTREFPKEETYGLTSQIRRAAMSIPTNIAEGCGRRSDADFCRFLQISVGSASEVDYELQLAHELNYLADAEYAELAKEVVEIRKMIAKLIDKTNKQ
ncbi:MAG: four helix bundle protein [Salinivirgaceae bacterium]|nr:four helix bundle protein [Salinivirgaceae bacterium]